jgi:DNA-binding response OmpR family regulator
MTTVKEKGRAAMLKENPTPIEVSLNNKKILIVEDENIVAKEIKSYLSNLGYHIISIISSAKNAYYQAIKHEVDLILMDIYLQKNNAITIALKIKKEKNIPIIFLSAHMDEASIDRAIQVNPVAYLTKPFNRQELFAAIKIGLSHCRRTEHSLIGDIVLDYEFSFDSKSSQLICCGEEIHLSKKERQLLKLFIQHKNMLISFMTMEYELWVDKPSNDSRRRTLISRLRTKLKHRFIETYASEGYIFKV